MTSQTLDAALAALDDSLGQIVADTNGADLSGWPLEALRHRWTLNHDAMLIDTYAGAISELCDEVTR